MKYILLSTLKKTAITYKGVEIVFNTYLRTPKWQVFGGSKEFDTLSELKAYIEGLL